MRFIIKPELINEENVLSKTRNFETTATIKHK